MMNTSQIIACGNRARFYGEEDFVFCFLFWFSRPSRWAFGEMLFGSKGEAFSLTFLEENLGLHILTGVGLPRNVLHGKINPDHSG